MNSGMPDPGRSGSPYEGTAPDPAWAAHGTCATHPDPNLWFTDTRAARRTAKAICRRCPVAAPCLAYALSQPGLTGIWAATTAKTRTRMINHNPKPVPPGRTQAA